MEKKLEERSSAIIADDVAISCFFSSFPFGTDFGEEDDDDSGDIFDVLASLISSESIKAGTTILWVVAVLLLFILVLSLSLRSLVIIVMLLLLLILLLISWS